MEALSSEQEGARLQQREKETLVRMLAWVNSNKGWSLLLEGCGLFAPFGLFAPLACKILVPRPGIEPRPPQVENKEP